MSQNRIRDSVHELIERLPSNVILVAAAKTRTPDEVNAAIEAGVRHIGYNYLQEAQDMKQYTPETVTWHMIGHLQRNKARTALDTFDMIETVDSVRLARTLNRHCAVLNQRMEILIEVNSGREPNKHGLFPEDVETAARAVSKLEFLHLRGLMTMGPWHENPEDLRPYFKLTREIFLTLESADLPGLKMELLSMGMSDSYKVAIEEGANIVRIGTRLFGPRSR